MPLQQNIIDCDAAPFIPYEDWQVEEHKKSGQFIFNPKELKFYRSKKQIGAEYIKGWELREELADKQVLNANVLDYLLKHPDIIPNEWKNDENENILYIYFWGTIYRSLEEDNLYVRNLHFYDGKWTSERCWLKGYFFTESPAIYIPN